MNFHTDQEAQRIGGLVEAISAISNELSRIRFRGIAAALLEASVDSAKRSAQVTPLLLGVSVEEAENAFGLPGIRRVVHISIRQADTLVALPASIAPAHLMGEGSYSFDPGANAIHAQLLELFKHAPQEAIRDLSELLDEAMPAPALTHETRPLSD